LSVRGHLISNSTDKIQVAVVEGQIKEGADNRG